MVNYNQLTLGLVEHELEIIMVANKEMTLVKTLIALFSDLYNLSNLAKVFAVFKKTENPIEIMSEKLDLEKPHLFIKEFVTKLEIEQMIYPSKDVLNYFQTANTYLDTFQETIVILRIIVSEEYLEFVMPDIFKPCSAWFKLLLALIEKESVVNKIEEWIRSFDHFSIYSAISQVSRSILKDKGKIIDQGKITNFVEFLGNSMFSYWLDEINAMEDER